MKKNYRLFWWKGYGCCFLLFFLFICPSPALAQKDSLQRDTKPVAADTVPKQENIKANLTKVDTTAPAVYKINPVKTLIIGMAATAANMIAINNILHNKKDLTVAEVEAANPASISGFDRLPPRSSSTRDSGWPTLSSIPE